MDHNISKIIFIVIIYSILRHKRRNDNSNGDKTEPSDAKLENEDDTTANTTSFTPSLQP